MTTKKQIFLEQILKGGRFDGPTPFLAYPILPDLTAYLDIVVAVAKELYLKNNPNKVRIPKKFESRFNVGVAEIKSGSTVPVFERSYDQESWINDEFDQARDLINEQLLFLQNEVKQNSVGINDFPEKVIPLFGRFGQHLKQDETITLKIPGKNNAPIYSRDIRSQVLSINKKSYQDICYLSGAISGFEVESGVFNLVVGDGERIIGPLSDTFDTVLRDLASKYKKEEISVTLIGLAKYQPDGSIAQIERLQHIAIFRNGEPNYFPNPNKRIDEFTKYQNGWLDGEGLAFDSQDLCDTKEWIEKLLKIADIPAPFVYPSPENSVIAEWSFGFWEVNCLFEFTTKTIILQATHTKREEIREEKLRLDDPLAPEQGSHFLKDLLETRLR